MMPCRSGSFDGAADALATAAWLADGPAVAGASVGVGVVELGDGVAAVPPHAASRIVEAAASDTICRIGRRCFVDSLSSRGLHPRS